MLSYNVNGPGEGYILQIGVPFLKIKVIKLSITIQNLRPLEGPAFSLNELDADFNIE